MARHDLPTVASGANGSRRSLLRQFRVFPHLGISIVEMIPFVVVIRLIHLYTILNTAQIKTEAFKPWPVILNEVKNLNVGRLKFFALLRMTGL
jgi:hypothetical protein